MGAGRLAASCALLAVTLLGCGSPEATRTRGGGPGADGGNRGPTVSMHEGSEPYFETPRMLTPRVTGRAKTGPVGPGQAAR
jgi:hypothetical protein